MIDGTTISAPVNTRPMMIRCMRSLPTILLIGVALLLLATAPAAGIVAIAYLGLPGETVTLLNAGPDPVEMTAVIQRRRVSSIMQ